MSSFGATRAVEPELRARVTEAVRRTLIRQDDRHPPGDPVERIADTVDRVAPLLEDTDREQLIRTVASGLTGLGVIDELLAVPDVTDIVINGPGTVWVERNGRLERTPFVIDSREMARCIERLVAPLDIRADRSNPVVDARLPDGSRVTVVLPPVAPGGPLLAVRRHSTRTRELETFCSSPGQVGLLERIMSERLNVLVYGATGSGKTSLVAALLATIPSDERVVIVEDTVELPVEGDNFVRLECHQPGPAGLGGVSIRDLVRVSLRLRPDRLIVGEVRGAESIDMIWAMSTGHRGSISTCHASTARDAIARLETMMLLGDSNLSGTSVRNQIDSAIDILIGMRRGEGGRRSIAQMDLLTSSGGLRPLVAESGVAR